MTLEVDILSSYYLPRFGVEDEQQRIYLGKLLDNIHAVLEEILQTTPAPDSAKYLLYDTPPATLPNANKLVAGSNITIVNGARTTTINSTSSLVSPLTTKGDIWVYSTTDAREPVGANGTVLTADSTQATGVKWNTIASGTITNIATTSPIVGGPITTTGTISINNAAADGSTKGAATFTASDFNDNGSGLISIDYTNGQVADASHKGFLTSTDWSTFNSKGSGTVTTTGSPATGNLTKFSGATSVTNGDLSGDVTTSGTLATTIANSAVTNAKMANMAAHTIKMNNTGSAAAPSDVTADAALIQSMYYASSTSGTTAYTATLAPVPVAYETGAQYSVTVTSTNTANAPTINFNSLGALNWFINGVAAAAYQIQAGVTYQGINDGAGNFRVTNQTINSIDSNLRYASIFADDFLLGQSVGAATSTQAAFSTFFTSGTASSITQSTSTEAAGMSGALTFNTGSTTSGFAGVNGMMGTSLTWATPPIFLGNGQLEIIWWFKSDSTLSNGIDRYFVTAGLSDQSLTPRGSANSIVLLYVHDANSGNWLTNVRVAGVTQTGANSSKTFTVNTLYVIKMVINAAATQADFYVTTYGNPFPGTPDVSYTGTFPATNIAFAPQLGIQKFLGTNSRKIIGDQWQYIQRLAR